MPAPATAGNRAGVVRHVDAINTRRREGAAGRTVSCSVLHDFGPQIGDRLHDAVDRAASGLKLPLFGVALVELMLGEADPRLVPSHRDANSARCK